MKRFFVSITLVMVLIMSMAACGDKDLTADKSAKEILQESITKSAEWKSYEMDISTHMKMDVPEEGLMEMNMTGSGAVIMDPMKMHMTLDMEMPEMEQPQTMEQYMIQEEDGFTIYQNIEGKWYKMSISDPSLVEMMSMDPMENISLFMEYLKSAEVVGEEVIKERDAVKIDLTVSFDMYKEFLEKNSSMDVGGILGSGIMESLSDAGDLTYTVWVDKTSMEIVKYYMDLSEAMQKIGEAMADQDDALPELSDIYKDIKMEMTMEVYNQNGVEDFEIPQEAMDAEELPFMN